MSNTKLVLSQIFRSKILIPTCDLFLVTMSSVERSSIPWITASTCAFVGVVVVVAVGFILWKRSKFKERMSLKYVTETRKEINGWMCGLF